MSPKAMTCEVCGGPLTFGAAFCTYCRVPLTWTRHVDIERGEQFFSLDLTRDSLPNCTASVSRRADGTVLTVKKADWQHWGTCPPKFRDACVALRGVALDESGEFGLYLRLHSEGKARAAYQLKVFPAYRSWRFRRESWSDPHAYADATQLWEFSPAVGGVGATNDVELRFTDSVFQVVLNGQRVATIVDASFGFGGMAWCVGSNPTPSQVLLQSVSAWRAR